MRLPHALPAVVLLLCACPAPKQPGPLLEAPGISTGDDTTAATLEATTATSSGVDPPNSSSSATTADPCGGACQAEGELCDFYAQDCEDGLKCMPHADPGEGTWTESICVPVAPDPGQLGDPCTVEGGDYSGLDTCDVGLICWDRDFVTHIGHCVELCKGSQQDPFCDTPQGFCYILASQQVAVCLPTCDPRDDDLACPPGQVCWLTPTLQGLQCLPDASGVEGQTFDDCAGEASCDPGLYCIDTSFAAECAGNSAGCCSPFCDVTRPDVCPGAGQECVSVNDGGLPVADLGLCALPI